MYTEIQNNLDRAVVYFAVGTDKRTVEFKINPKKKDTWPEEATEISWSPNVDTKLINVKRNDGSGIYAMK